MTSSREVFMQQKSRKEEMTYSNLTQGFIRGSEYRKKKLFNKGVATVVPYPTSRRQ